MKVVYIGQFTEGTTSKMRANHIKNILKPEVFEVIDIHVPFHETGKLWRSFGFRYKRGVLIRNINRYIQKHFHSTQYDLIWVDKGIFMNAMTMNLLRNHTKKLVHFTPDPAFTFHKSRLFDQSIRFYDTMVTTKSFELEHYHQHIAKSKVLYATQGFDKSLHQSADFKFSSKKGLVFIGHHEVEREEVIQKLLDNNVPVILAGIKWDPFYKANSGNSNLTYLGKGVYGKEYVKTLQQAKIAWGAISKWIPELHTTRTFEIPACATALLTERNKETETFFNEDEVIFYDNTDELVEKVIYYLNNDEELEMLTKNGYEKVQEDGFDYESILTKLLKQILP